MSENEPQCEILAVRWADSKISVYLRTAEGRGEAEAMKRDGRLTREGDAWRMRLPTWQIIPFFRGGLCEVARIRKAAVR